MVDVSKMIEDNAEYVRTHVKTYLESKGKQGHVYPGPFTGADIVTLLLRTTGRRSGRILYSPLIYRDLGDEFLIVASKGGHDQHPAWFFNLTAVPEATFQVGEHCYSGTWRIAAGEERERAWQHMVEKYPEYNNYQAVTQRQLPVILLKPQGKLAQL
jgi:deazaflavin-dependent oxidoreductase (nitroreductase family)